MRVMSLTLGLLELRDGSNYVSQDPVEAHFGLGSAKRARRVRILWPDGAVQNLRRVAANQHLVVEWPGEEPSP